MKCLICGHDGGIERYSSSNCSCCGQEYEYLWDGIAIVLTEDQLQTLRSLSHFKVEVDAT